MRLIKTALCVFLFVVFSFSFAHQARASLVTITGEGDVVVNVLADETSVALDVPQNQLVAVKNLVSGDDKSSKVALSKSNGKIQLNVTGDSGSKDLDVTNFKENVIEIDERPKTQKLSIRTDGDRFLIKQRGITAVTDYDIDIDPENAGLTLKTPSGLRFLSVLPRDAVDTVMKTQLINQIPLNEDVMINEEGGQLTYTVKGERTINVFDLFVYPLSVTTKVSAITGEILSIEDPKWLRFAAFLLV